MMPPASGALPPAMVLLMPPQPPLPSLPPSVYMDCGNLDRGPCLLLIIHTCLSYSLNVLELWMLFILVTWHPLLLSIQTEAMLYWRFLLWRFFLFFPPERFFSISWEFFLIRCEVLGQECRMCTDCKALWGKFIICDFGLYQWNWIEWLGLGLGGLGYNTARHSCFKLGCGLSTCSSFMNTSTKYIRHVSVRFLFYWPPASPLMTTTTPRWRP